MRALPLLLLILLASCQEVVLRVAKVPDNTPAGAVLFVGGDFNHSDPADQNFRLVAAPDGRYYVTLPRGMGRTGYKFTRGDWTSVETDPCGHPIQDRIADYLNSPDTVTVEINSWQDLGPTHCNRVVLRIKRLPAETPAVSSIYLASNYGDWSAHREEYRFRRQPNGVLLLDVEPRNEMLVYKITRGDWDNEAVDPNGGVKQNEELMLGGQDTVDIKIDAWKDINPGLLAGRRNFLIRVPHSTPAGDSVYMAGNFNGWNPHDTAYRLRRLPNGLCAISLDKRQGQLRFKLTRGSWDREELDAYRNTVDAHVLRRGPGTVEVTVEAWRDLASGAGETPPPADAMPAAPAAPEPSAAPAPPNRGDMALTVVDRNAMRQAAQNLERTAAQMSPSDPEGVTMRKEAAKLLAKANLKPWEMAETPDGTVISVEFPGKPGVRMVQFTVKDTPPYDRAIYVRLQLPGEPKNRNYGFSHRLGRRMLAVKVPVGTRLFSCDGPYWQDHAFKERFAKVILADDDGRIFTSKELQFRGEVRD